MRAFAAALALLWGATAGAWGVAGHRATARVAEAYLSPQVRAEVARLLAGEPEPTLAGVAAWADTVRSPGTARAHYVNLPADCRYDPARDCPRGQCLPAAMTRHLLVLADRGADGASRAVALKWVVHLAGDAHAPLHAGGRDDRGGNGHQMRWEGRGTNLHALWDTGLLRTRGEPERALVARLLADAGPQPAQASVREWLEEGCRIVQEEGFYPPRRPQEAAYLARWQGVLDRRLLDGGQRLAGLLEAALGR